METLLNGFIGLTALDKLCNGSSGDYIKKSDLQACMLESRVSKIESDVTELKTQTKTISENLAKVGANADANTQALTGLMNALAGTTTPVQATVTP